MKNPVIESLIAILVALVVAAGVAWAGSQGGLRVGGVSLFALGGLVAFAIQWIAFLPSYRAQTERWYDLTGSLTYLTLVIGAVLLAGRHDPRSIALAALVTIWALRLGTFLYQRIHESGRDGRFDDIKPSFTRFLVAWTLQGLWVFLTLGPALAAITAQEAPPFGAIGWIGVALWAAGFGIEAIADAQKRAFRDDPANKGRFIDSGLWAWSRHPNYFGEITLWTGIALIALPALSGWQHVTLISPLFVYVLLTRVSGIPMLESRADERWGEDPDYRAYKAKTPVLFPRPPRSPP
jgi:steroid 5-alpha reductase family enzyme